VGSLHAGFSLKPAVTCLDATGRPQFRYGDLDLCGAAMKSFQTNKSLLVLAAAAMTATPSIGFAWRTRERRMVKKP
ncbi:hypothetical protein, partial [Mesorhizobium sp.]|uniref:hypothetical protein n=3 Tax=Mesorhizobium sp. TaxID=1871066 RepID=UPI0025E163E0